MVRRSVVVTDAGGFVRVAPRLHAGGVHPAGRVDVGRAAVTDEREAVRLDGYLFPSANSWLRLVMKMVLPTATGDE